MGAPSYILTLPDEDTSEGAPEQMAEFGQLDRSIAESPRARRGELDAVYPGNSGCAEK